MLITMLAEFKQVSMYVFITIVQLHQNCNVSMNCVTSQYQISCTFVQWLMVYYLQTYRETG